MPVERVQGKPKAGAEKVPLKPKGEIKETNRGKAI
jgi:hypothetical protein